MSIGNLFQFDFGKVGEAISKFSKYEGDTNQNQEIVKGYGPKVQAAWIGGDADEFVLDLGRKLVPKYAEFAAAFTGVQLNLTRSGETVTGADDKASKLADDYANDASQIYPG